MLLLKAAAIAQSAVVHFYVDPVNGVDAAALAANPLFQPAPAPQHIECATTIVYPTDLHDGVQTVLLHAPYPFKTISAALAAIPPLPTQPGATGIVWEHAIIHLMPGRYSRSMTQYQPNGFLGNGETFPIRLPDNVSIQGASALNTVLDVETATQGQLGPIFEFGQNRPTPPQLYPGDHSFIDNVTLTGVYAAEPDPQNLKLSAAIWLDPTSPSAAGASPTITNCFFYGNQIGIAAVSGAEGSAVHTATVIHNTFAWNQCGIWSGQNLDPEASAIGISRLVVLNNIFDASPPDPLACPYPSGSGWNHFHGVATIKSGFEGIDITDMSIAGVNYNAFEHSGQARKYDLTIAFLPYYPPTTTRSAPVFPVPVASRNIHAYTGGVNSDSTRRGVLYIRDLICNGTASFRPSANFDLSPHDFRLAPAVSLAGNDALLPPSALNPLVDNGWWGSFSVTLDNGRTLSDEPGSLSLSSPAAWLAWPFSSWDEDCDGYGNPRAINHAVYADNGLGTDNVFTDIGADELGELIVIGGRFQSTLFVDDSPQPLFPSAVMDNKYLWYLGPPTSLLPAWKPSHSNTSKPKYRSMAAVLGVPPILYYVVPPQWSAWSFTGQPYYLPRPVDITPHLVPDVHPWWQSALGITSNPIWKRCTWPALYNPALFVSPSTGIIHPPGSYLGASVPTGNFAWLDGFDLFDTSPVFEYLGALGPLPAWADLGGPWGTNGADAFDHFDSWCVATDSPAGRRMETFKPTWDSQLPPTQPPKPASLPVALRYTLEVPDVSTWAANPLLNPLGNSNIQSFLVFVDGQVHEQD